MIVLSLLEMLMDIYYLTPDVNARVIFDDEKDRVGQTLHDRWLHKVDDTWIGFFWDIWHGDWLDVAQDDDKDAVAVKEVDVLLHEVKSIHCWIQLKQIGQWLKEEFIEKFEEFTCLLWILAIFIKSSLFLTITAPS